MRKLIVAFALLLGVSFLFFKKAEVQAIIGTLQRGDVRFILLALLVEGFWLLNVAASYRVVYRSLGLAARINKLLVLASAAIFVNIIAPSVGMGGMAIFVSQARRDGQSSARVMVASMLFVLFEYLGFLCVLGAGLFVLLRRDSLNSAVLAATIILVGVAGGMAALIYLGMQSGERLGRALAWLARRAGVLLRPFLPADTISERRAEAFAQDVAASLRALQPRGESLLLPAVLAVSSKGLLILVLYLMFRAFQVPVSAGTLVAGFSIGYLFLIVSPTPAGIGIVEGALALALNSLQVPLEEAAVIALAYRGITFWIPLVAGMWAFRSLSHMGKKRLAPARERLPAIGSIVPAIRNRGELNQE